MPAGGSDRRNAATSALPIPVRRMELIRLSMPAAGRRQQGRYNRLARKSATRRWGSGSLAAFGQAPFPRRGRPARAAERAAARKLRF